MSIARRRKEGRVSFETSDTPAARCWRCDRPASNAWGNSYICDECQRRAELSEDTTDKERLRTRLKQADALADRFVALRDGTKSAYEDPTDPDSRSSVVPSENYGIYCDGTVVAIDIDEYDSPAAAGILSGLPTTFVTRTAHDGEHHLFVVEGDVADRFDDQFDAKSPQGGFGETRVDGLYVVGPGSQLDGCDKEGCDDCQNESGGRYTILHDEPIATLDAEEFTDAVSEYLTTDAEQDAGESRESRDDESYDYDGLGGTFDGDVDQRLEYALDNDEKLRNLWNGNYAAEGFDDRSEPECSLAAKLGFWFERDREVVRRLLDRADIKKWHHRTDSAYRDSVLDAVEIPSDTYGEAGSYEAVPDVDPADVGLDPSEYEMVSLEEARDRCEAIIADAMEQGREVLVEAIPSIGKSYSTFAAAAETEVPITYLSPRHETYDQARDWCEEFGLSHLRLPSATNDCPTFSGDHGQRWQQRVMRYYDSGLSARAIHDNAKALFGGEIPCQPNERGSCPYARRWNFDPDDYDVLIGHHKHANNRTATEGRVVIFDEYPEDGFDETIESATETVRQFLTQELNDDAVPDDVDGALSLLGTPLTEMERLDLFAALTRRIEDTGNESRVMEIERADDDAHVLGAHVTYVFASEGEQINGYNRVTLPDGTVGLLNDDLEVILRQPPMLNDAEGVVALDGTPVVEQWRSVTGLDLDHERVLSDAERGFFLTEMQGWEFVQTTEDNAYSYSGPGNAEPRRDAELVAAVDREHDSTPAIISTAKALGSYDRSDAFPIEEYSTENYGNLKSSNDLAGVPLGIVIGSPHYGDGYVHKEAALLGVESERQGYGTDASFGSEVADAILKGMREYEVLQAALRFGRAPDVDATVYVHTAAIPEWVPRTTLKAVRSLNDTQQAVIGYCVITDDPWTVSEVYNEIDMSRSMVTRTLNDLADEGLLRKDGTGQSNEYYDEGIGDVSGEFLITLPDSGG